MAGSSDIKSDVPETTLIPGHSHAVLAVFIGVLFPKCHESVGVSDELEAISHATRYADTGYETGSRLSHRKAIVPTTEKRALYWQSC